MPTVFLVPQLMPVTLVVMCMYVHNLQGCIGEHQKEKYERKRKQQRQRGEQENWHVAAEICSLAKRKIDICFALSLPTPS